MTLSAFVVSSDLVKSLSTAVPGEVILMLPGTYSGVSINNMNFTTPVTIRSYDLAHPAVFTDFFINGSSGLKFSNLQIFANNPVGLWAATINHSSNISFDQVSVHGSMDGTPADDEGGITFSNSSNISITNSEFQQLGRGIAAATSDHVTISGNNVHDIRSDGIDGAAASNVLISNNTFRDFFPAPLDHPDAIQFWTQGTTASAHDITITNNVMTRGLGMPTQGVFLDDTVGLPFLNLTITNNAILGETYNGVAVYGASNLKISGNTLESYMGLQSYIRVSNANLATITNNNAFNYVYTNDTNITSTGNITNSMLVEVGLSDAIQSKVSYTLAADVNDLLLTGTGLTGTANKSGGDILTSLLGGNTLVGGAGDDVFHIFHSNDSIIVAAGTPNETVLTTASYTLAANIQNLTADGYAAIKLVGNAMDNVITANNGGDTLTGAGGNDTFVIAPHQKVTTITDFDAGGAVDRIDVSAYLQAGLTPYFKDLGGVALVAFTNGEYFQVQGVHAADLQLVGDYIV